MKGFPALPLSSVILAVLYITRDDHRQRIARKRQNGQNSLCRHLGVGLSRLISSEVGLPTTEPEPLASEPSAELERPADRAPPERQSLVAGLYTHPR